MTSLLIYAVAAVAAAMSYAYIAGFLYDNIIHELVQHVLTRNFNLMLESGKNAQSITRAIPVALRLLIGQKNGDVDALPVGEASSLAGDVIELALHDPIMTVLYTVGFLLVFTLAAFIMRSLTRALTAINHVPVIGFVNTVLGGIAGVLEGVLCLYVSGFALRLAVTVSGGMWWWLNNGVIDATYIWRVFY